MAALVVSFAWADSVTFTPDGSVPTAAAYTLTEAPITLTCSNGLVNTTQIRVYKNQTLTVSAAEGYTITGVEFTCTASGTSQYGPGCFTADQGNYSYDGTVGTWSGSASEIVFTASTNQVRATQIVVTYSSGSVVVVAAPVITPAGGVFETSQEVTITAEAGDIYYTLDGTDPDEDATAYAAPFTITDDATVKAIAIDNGVSSAITTATFTKAITTTGAGTVESPYTVADALALIGGNQIPSDSVYVSGVITGTPSVSTSYGNANYYITDNGDTTLYIFRGKYLQNTLFTATDQIKEGDAVVVYGKLTLYNSTPEMAANNYIYSLNGQTEAQVDTTVVTNFTEANAATGIFRFDGQAVVTYQFGNYLYVRDANAKAGLIYGSVGQSYNQGNYVPAGWTGIHTLYNGMDEYTNLNGFTAAVDSTTVEPVAKTTLVAADANEYVSLANMPIYAETDTAGTITNVYMVCGTDTLLVYNRFNVTLPEWDATKTYNFTGIATVYNNAAQLCPITVEEATATAIDINGDGAWSMADVTTLIAFVLGNQPSPCIEENCDVNGDGGVSMADVTTLIGNILGN